MLYHYIAASCNIGEFYCAPEDFCLPPEYICDGILDCSVGSNIEDITDESNCPPSKHTILYLYLNVFLYPAHYEVDKKQIMGFRQISINQLSNINIKLLSRVLYITNRKRSVTEACNLLAINNLLMLVCVLLLIVILDNRFTRF